MRVLLRREAGNFLRYFSVALVGLAADWAAWSFLVWTGWNPVAAQGVGKALGAVVAFFGMRSLVFPGRGPVAPQVARFCAAAVGGWCLGVAAFALLVQALPPVPAKIASDGVTFACNWLVMRFWAFRPSQA